MDSFSTFLFSEVASTETFIGLVVLLGLVLMVKKRVREGAALMFGAAGMGVTVWLMKMLFAVERIPGGLLPVDTYAFPSGHAAASMFLGVVALLYLQHMPNRWQRYGLSIAAAGLVLSIGASRVIYIVHTPLQVIAGFVIGALWGWLTYLLMRGFIAVLKGKS